MKGDQIETDNKADIETREGERVRQWHALSEENVLYRQGETFEKHF